LHGTGTVETETTFTPRQKGIGERLDRIVQRSDARVALRSEVE